MPFPEPAFVDRLLFYSIAEIEAYVRQLDLPDREKLLTALRDRAAAYERDNASEELQLVRIALEVAEAGRNEISLQSTSQPASISTRTELEFAATRCSDPDEAINLFQQHEVLLEEKERALLREMIECRAEAKRLYAAKERAAAATVLRRAVVLCLQLGLRFPAAALGLTVAQTRGRDGHLRSALADARLCAAIADTAELPELALRARLLACSMLEALDQGDAAVAEYESVATQAAARQSRSIEFQARIGSAASFHNRGRHVEAASVLRSALLSVTAWGTRQQVAALRNNLGRELLALGRVEQAAEEFQAALALQGNADSRAQSLFGLGDVKMLLGERDEAYDYWRQAYQLGYFSGNHGQLLTAFASRVVAHGMDISGGDVGIMGEFSGSTAGMLKFGLYSAIHDGSPVRALTFASWLARELASSGDVEGGIALCRDILTEYAHVDERSAVLQALRLTYASLLLRQEIADHQQVFDVLWEIYTMVDNQIEEALLDTRRGEFVGKYLSAIEMLISLLLDHGEGIAIPEAANPRLLAFDIHEAAKARGFLAALGSLDVAAPAEIDPELRQREAELIRLRRELQTEADLTGSGKLLSRIQEIQSRLRNCWQQMQDSTPAFVRLRRGIPSGLEDARRVLLERATRPMAIVSFFCAEDHTRIFVLRSDDPEVRIVRSEVGRDVLGSAVRRLRSTFSTGDFPDLGPIRRTNPWRRSLGFFESLGEELLKFMPLVSGIELLCFIPHGPLHGLPLHALPDSDGVYLVERAGTVYVPSISSLSYVLSTKSPPPDRTPSVYVAGVAAREDAHPDYLEHDDELFAGDRWDVSAHSGPAVTKHQALRSSSGRRVLHITCHGYFNERSPLDSGLLLANGRERPSRLMHQVSALEQARTILTAREVMSTFMDAEIVVLRACSSSVHGARNAGDELDGLSRSFLYAGNSAVMASLWNVDQKSSRNLLRSFYQKWSDPIRKPEKWQALQQAQQEFLRSGEEPYLRHPYHWAPFVLHGDWR